MKWGVINWEKGYSNRVELSGGVSPTFFDSPIFDCSFNCLNMFCWCIWYIFVRNSIIKQSWDEFGNELVKTFINNC